jgi:predicted secreted protein
MKMTCLLVALICLLGLGACNQQTAAPEADHVVSDLDLPATVDARVGETIDLALASNASTGFSWHCTWEPEAALVKIDWPVESNDSQLPGSGGTTHFAFRAAQPGTVVITVQYGRWWEGGERQEPQTVTVNITP